MFMSLLRSLTGAEYNNSSGSGADSGRSSMVDGTRTSPRTPGGGVGGSNSEHCANDVVFGHGFSSSAVPFCNVYALSVLVSSVCVLCCCCAGVALTKQVSFT
jgi:hypothetical protein